MKQLLSILLVLALTGCCQFKFDDNDFLLNENELSFFAAYTPGQTIYFEDQSGDQDTIKIISISPTNTDPSSVCGKGLFMNPRPENTKSIRIEHLPYDKWAGKTEEHFSNGEVKVSVDYQTLFSITKFPVEKEVENQVAFKNFRSGLMLNALQKEPLMLNGKTWTNYFIAENTFPEGETDSLSVHKVYWTVKDGLIAYETKNGRIWTKK